MRGRADGWRFCVPPAAHAGNQLREMAIGLIGIQEGPGLFKSARGASEKI